MDLSFCPTGSVAMYVHDYVIVWGSYVATSQSDIKALGRNLLDLNN